MNLEVEDLRLARLWASSWPDSLCELSGSNAFSVHCGHRHLDTSAQDLGISSLQKMEIWRIQGERKTSRGELIGIDLPSSRLRVLASRAHCRWAAFLLA